MIRTQQPSTEPAADPNAGSVAGAVTHLKLSGGTFTLATPLPPNRRNHKRHVGLCLADHR